MDKHTKPPTSAPTTLARGAWARLHHEASLHARAANSAAGLAARHQLGGNPTAASGARALAAWHRANVGRCAARAHARVRAALVAALCGEDLHHAHEGVTA